MHLRAIFAALALSILSGCATAEYLAQAGCGQVDIMLRARDLGRAAKDESLPAETRALLSAVPDIKKFGERHSLRPTGSYHTFVQLDRPVVVYVVNASEPLRFRAKTWSFPIVGRVPYLGWFDRDDARAFADELRAEGLDVDLGGAEAYSTLGWFDDPVLSTMLGSGDDAIGDLAEVVLHESVHATLFVHGQTRFNESLAEFVSSKLARVYLDERFGKGSRQRVAFDEAEKRGAARREKMHAAYEELSALYASNKPDAEKLAEKRRVLVALRRATRFRRPINNATLSAFKNYHSGTPELEALLDACGGSLPRMLSALSPLKDDPKAFKEPNQADLGPVVMPLVRAGCPAPKASTKGR